MKITKYMDFINPTEEFVGKRRAIQGFGIYGKYTIILYHTGVCALYDLETRSPEPLDVIKLASYNDGPDKRYINHANDVMFAGQLDDGRPLIYIQAGNSGECDENGFIACCEVEAVNIAPDENGKIRISTEAIQTIYYKNDGIENTPYQTPGWGWPSSLVDIEKGYYYLFSARYRTKIEFIDKYDDNNYILTRFPLPKIGERYVTLTPAHIIEQFELPFDILFTQGGTLRDGIIYYTFGCGKPHYPNAMRIIDANRGEMTGRIDLSNCIFAEEEIECCAFYGDRLMVNTAGCAIYEIELD